MNYKEKYDKAIEALRSLFAEQAIKHCDRVNIKDITNIFSELKESDDEKVRKHLISLFENFVTLGVANECETSEIKVDDILAWLEKQGEQKPADLPKGEDYGIDSLYHAARILEKTLGEVDGYQSDDGILEHKCAIEAVNRLYKQKPAEYNKEISTNLKDIVDNEANAIWEEESSDGCHLVIDSFNMFYGICMQIAEAVVDYKKPAAWSKEDEAVLDALIRRFKGEDIYVSPNSVVECLECIKERYTWKPSEEQMKALEHAISCYSGISPTNGHEVFILEIMKEQLKKLREE